MNPYLKLIFILIALATGTHSYSQRLIEKLGLYAAPGAVFVQGNENPDNYSRPQNAFGSFKPGISFNACLLYYFNPKISFGLDAQFFSAKKPNHFLFNTNIGPIAKYNLISSYNIVSPFVMGGIKFGYSYLNRSGYKWSETDIENLDQSSADIQRINFASGSASFGIPTFGLLAGTGVDITVSPRLKIFVMGSYAHQFTKNNKLLKENYPGGATNLSFITVEAGINYRLANSSKNKHNLNNLAAYKAEQRRSETMQKLAQATAKKTQEEKEMSETPDPSAPRMNFKTLAKEDLDPNKKYTVNGQVLSADGKKPDDLSVLILDEKGNIIATAKPDKNGNFAYKGLKADNYTVALNKEDPKLTANANLYSENPELKVDASALNKFAYNKLASGGKPAGIILGEAVLNDGGQPASDQTMLLLDETGKVIATTKTNKDGKYAFRNLKSENYQVVAADDPSIKANAIAASGDPSLKIDENKFKQISSRTLANGQHPEPVVTGQVIASEDKKPDDKSIILLDHNGNIVGKTISNKEGKFAFKGLEADDYQAVIEGNPAGITAKAGLAATDPSLKLPDQSFEKFENDAQKVITGNVTVPQGQNAGTANVLLMDDKGNVTETAKVNKEGNFVFKNVRTATYQVVVEGADYEKMVFDVGKEDPKNASLTSSEFTQATANQKGNVVVGKIDMGNQTLPLEGANVVLIDEKGLAAERTTADKDGNFTIKDVRSANYQAVVEGQNYEKVVMDVTSGANAGKVSAQDFFKHDFPKLTTENNLSANNIVTGKATSTIPGKDMTDQTVMLINDQGNIVGKTIVNKNGTFTFKGLKADNYQTVMEKPEPDVKTSMAPMVKDPDMKISMKDVMKYNPISKSMESLTDKDNIVITGTIKSDDLDAADNRTIMLLDENENVIKEVISDKDGVFQFEGIKAKEYQVVYEDGAKKVTPSLQMYKDNDPAVTEQGGKIAKTLFFGLNEFKLDENDKAELEKFVKYFIEHPDVKMIKLNAYGDATGTDEANMEVTQKRADQVMEYLEKRGIPKEKLKLNPMGKSLKFKNKYNKPDLKLNRKVDIEIVE